MDDTSARPASFAGKAKVLAGRSATSRPSPRALPRGASRRPSSDSPPDCAAWAQVWPHSCSAQSLRQATARNLLLQEKGSRERHTNEPSDTLVLPAGSERITRP